MPAWVCGKDIVKNVVKIVNLFLDTHPNYLYSYFLVFF